MDIAARTRQERTPAPAATGFYTLTDQTFGESRRRLISYLVKLNHALDNDLPDLAQALLSRFCDHLVDYLCEGHFRVFRRLSMPAESYAVIETTTRAAIAFNDRYGTLTEVRVATVKDALEQIARVITRRFEVEDQVLAGEGGRLQAVAASRR